MKDFDSWLSDQGEPQPPTTEEELPEGLWEVDGVIYARCCSCDNRYEWPGDPKDGFDPNMSYCGGSQYCTP